MPPRCATVPRLPSGPTTLTRPSPISTASSSSTPKNAQAYYQRGFAYEQQGQRAKAIDDYSKAIEPRRQQEHDARSTDASTAEEQHQLQQAEQQKEAAGSRTCQAERARKRKNR